MPEPVPQIDLLTTKLQPPPVREGWVLREGLLHRLDGALRQKLTLVCAPAGHGKTTLLRQWISRLNQAVGWLSLDRDDNDLAQFLHYFLAAIQQVDPQAGALIPGMLKPPRPHSGRAIGIALINDLAACSREFILILDDYQEVEVRPIHDFLEHLIENMPANVHLVLATRADPPINLAQLRARGQMLELRAADLCFNRDEAGSFFQQAMGQPFPERELAALVKKTEGWAAGLQIAALLLHDQPDLSRAVRAFTGSHRHILDYLATEVIDRLPGPVQDFLVETAILDDLEASLCDAVTGRSDSRQILEQLDRDNQFIVALDEDHRWYRYHRLMAEALRRRSDAYDRLQLLERYRRASVWYEEQGMLEPAIRYGFKASDLQRAAALIEAGAVTILKRSQVETLLDWLKQLPEDLIQERPRLNIAYAWALLLRGGSLQAVHQRLEAAGQQTVGAFVPGEQAVIQGLMATLTGNAEQGLAWSRQALEDLPVDRTFLRTMAVDNLGMAYVLQGDIPSAIQAFRDGIALALDTGNIMFAAAAQSNLGGLYLLQGHLRLAEAVYRQALALATTPYGQRMPVACRALLGLGEINREWNDLAQARRQLEEGQQLAQQYNEIGELVMMLSLARVLQSQGERDGALDQVQKAQTLAIQSSSTDIDDRLVEVSLARMWLQQGNLSGALEWAARRGFEQVPTRQSLAESDPPGIPYDIREAEWLVYARLLLAQRQATPALEVLAMLMVEAENQGRARRLHEILVQMALAYQVLGADDLAVTTLKRSLQQAEPEGYTRVYLDEGQAMIALLREAARRGVMRPSIHRLLSEFQRTEQAREPVPAGSQSGLVEPLSEREIEVLELLAEGCTNREIGERLYISLSTVKGHISNLSGKLLARNRTEAVARARQLGILPQH